MQEKKEKKKYATPIIYSEEIVEVKVVACGKCEIGSPIDAETIACIESSINT